MKNFASFKTIRCKLKPVRSWTFVRICRLKPNKRKMLRSAISLTAFGFCRCHCDGGIPDYFQYFPCALRGIASRAIRSQAQRLKSSLCVISNFYKERTCSFWGEIFGWLCEGYSSCAGKDSTEIVRILMKLLFVCLCVTLYRKFCEVSYLL